MSPIPRRTYDTLDTGVDIFSDFKMPDWMPDWRSTKDSMGLFDGFGGEGGKQKFGGVLGPAVQAFSAFNNYQQGNKMLDLQEDAFDFSQEKFWTNMAMQQDQYNRAANRSTKNMAYSAFSPQNGQDKRSFGQGLDQTYNTGNLIDMNGVQQPNVIKVPDQYLNNGTAQAVTAQPVGAAKAIGEVPAGGRPNSAFAKGNVQQSGVPPKKILA